MAISLIRSAESHTGSTGSVSENSFTFAVGQAGDAPKGILIFVFQGVAYAEKTSSVTYGGTTVPAFGTDLASWDTTTEPGRVRAFFLGSSVPQGAPSGGVVVNRTNDTTTMYAVAYLLGGSTDLEEKARYTAGSTGNAAAAQQSIAAGSMTTQIFAALYSGGPTLATGSNMTAPSTSTSLAYSSYSFQAGHETTPTTGTRTRGLTLATDDLGYIIIALGEVPPRTADGVLKVQLPLMTGTATNAPPSRSATIAFRHQPPLFTATATNVPPARAADTAFRIQAPLVSGQATNVTAPPRAGDAIQRVQLPLFTATATNVPPPPRSATTAFRVQTLLMTATATNVAPPARTATATYRIQSLLLPGTAENVAPPARSATTIFRIQAPVLLGSATNVPPPARTANVTYRIQTPLIVGIATNEAPPARTATGILRAQGAIVSGSATNTPIGVVSATGTLRIARLKLVATATNETPPARSATVTQSIQPLGMSGTVTNTAPPSRSASGGVAIKSLTLGVVAHSAAFDREATVVLRVQGLVLRSAAMPWYRADKTAWDTSSRSGWQEAEDLLKWDE